jgi:cell division protein FtsW (lipid II flippase)
LSWLAVFRRPLPAFTATSLLAVALGAVVCALSGVPAGVWGRNLGAWFVGGLAAATLARWAGPHTLRAVAVLTPLGLAATLLGEGQQGVHRWLVLGPLSMNVAMVLLPAFVVALAVLAPRAAGWWIAALLALGVLVLQPDTSQATALALAVCVAAFGLPTPSARLRWGLALVVVSLAALSWTRPDPLAPVPEVEEVIRLAAVQSPLLAGLSVLSLVAFSATPWFATRTSPVETVRCAGRALGALFLAWSAAPAFGAFPVPLVGVGLSPILGAWLGVGLLAAVARAQPTE